MIPIEVQHSGYLALTQIPNTGNGSLMVAESGINIPFEYKRVYFINQFEESHSLRGRHAHRHLNQVIFAVSGSFLLELDDGCARQTLLIESNGTGVRLGPMLWHTLSAFSPNCCVLVFASDHYDEDDYIRNYDHFLQLATQSKSIAS